MSAGRSEARAAEEDPNDPAPRLAFAEANLALGLEAPRTYPANPRMARIVVRDRDHVDPLLGGIHVAARHPARTDHTDIDLFTGGHMTGSAQDVPRHDGKRGRSRSRAGEKPSP